MLSILTWISSLWLCNALFNAHLPSAGLRPRAAEMTDSVGLLWTERRYCSMWGLTYGCGGLNGDSLVAWVDNRIREISEIIGLPANPAVLENVETVEEGSWSFGPQANPCIDSEFTTTQLDTLVPPKPINIIYIKFGHKIFKLSPNVTICSLGWINGVKLVKVFLYYSYTLTIMLKLLCAFLWPWAVSKLRLKWT